ncbi:MAG: hypothetical protein QM692_09425 [Thermomicrobiales bacterium]
MSGAQITIILGVGIILLACVVLLPRLLRRGGPPAPAAAAPLPASAPAPARPSGPALSGLAADLLALEQAGQWDQLIRLLDTTLPEWPVSSSLIEVARATGNLEHDLALLPQDAVSGVVITRLQAQTHDVTQRLWVLADQLVLAERMRGPALQPRLEREDAVLLRLLPAIQTAQSELVELTLGGQSGAVLERAEGRFLALADTARELQELG